MSENFIIPWGRLMFEGLPHPKPRSVIDDLLDPNPSVDAKMVYLTNPPSDNTVEYVTHHTIDGETVTAPARYKFSGADERHSPDVEGNAIPLAMTREPTYRTEFKLQPYQTEAVQQIMEQTYEDYRRAMDQMVAAAFFVTAKRFGKTVTSTTAAETAIKMDEMRKKLEEAERMQIPSIHYSTIATKPTSERLFPFSPHRSARISKKLMKRFGGVYRHEPAIYQLNGLIIAHPSFREKIDAALTASLKGQNK